VSGPSKDQQARLVQKAEQVFAKERHQREVLDEGRGHHDEIMVKTAKLRELRLAKEVAEHEAAAKVKTRNAKQMTPAQCRAARGIAFMTQSKLAEVAQVPRGVIIDFELSLLPPKPAYLEAMRRVLEERGVEFIEGEPPSVRPRI
jgi:hypothetical protein